MKRDEAIEVLETISELYPQKFDITERVANMLLPKLLEMDYRGMLAKLYEGRKQCPEQRNCYFIDDENSKDLFL